MLIAYQFSRAVVMLLLGLSGPIQAAEVAPRKTREQAEQWVIRGKREACRLLEEREVSCIAFSSDTKILATLEKSRLRIWEWQERKRLFDIRIPNPEDKYIAFSKNGRYVTSGTTKGGIVLWDLSKKAKKVILKSNRALSGLVGFSPDSTLLAAGGKSEILVWTLPGGVRPRVLKGPALKEGVSYIPRFVDGNYLVTGDLDGRIRRWDVKRRRQKLVRDVKLDASSVHFTIDFPKDYEKVIVPGLIDCRVLAGGKRLVCLVNVGATTAGPFEKTKSGASSGYRDFETQVICYISVIDIGTGKEVRHSKRDDACIWNMAVTADGRYIFVGSCRYVLTTLKHGQPVESISRSSVRVLDAATGKECYRYEVDNGTLPMVAVSPDARYVAVAFRFKKGVIIYRTPKAVWVESTGQKKKKPKRAKSTK